MVVMFSGRGSNFQSLINAVAAGYIPNTVLSLAISNQPGVEGLQRAAQAGIPHRCIMHKEFPDRESFDAAMMREMEPHDPDLVVLAGFLRIVGPAFVKRYEGCILNIHPSLLPRHPGMHPHRKALAAADVDHGATVHFVDPGLDTGPRVIQARTVIYPWDNEETLAWRVLPIEHAILVESSRWFMEDRLRMEGSQVFLDGEALGDRGVLYTMDEEAAALPPLEPVEPLEESAGRSA